MYSKEQIDWICNSYKKWYAQYYPLCIFCGHKIKKGEADLAHLVRRSYSLELQTNKLNTGNSHRHCHDIFDNDYQGAVCLPRITECLYIIWLLSPDYLNLIAPHFEQLSDAIAQFPGVEYKDIKHHGEILTLQYLYQ